MNYIRSNKKGQSGGATDYISCLKHIVSPNWEKGEPFPANEEIPRVFNYPDYAYFPQAAVADQLTYTNVPRNHNILVVAGWYSNGLVGCVFTMSEPFVNPYPNSNLPLRTDGSMYWSGLLSLGNFRNTATVEMKPFTGGVSIRAGYPLSEAVYLTTYDIYSLDNLEIQRKNCNFSDFKIQFAA